MRIYIFILLTFVYYGLIECYKLQEVPKYPIGQLNRVAFNKKSDVPSSGGGSGGGVWKTHTEWKSYWMKEWTQKTVYVPIWKKIWAPVEINKWIPITKAPNGQKRP